MEKAYLDQNRRCYEITRQISLKALKADGWERLKGKDEHTCEFDLTETFFDQDYPGHYLRRIKSVSLTVEFAGDLRPSNVNCTLTLLKSSVRISNATTGDYARKEPEDVRFREEIGAFQSIVASSGRDDNGLFVHDLDDDRYLPFEGAGAISRWRIEMPPPERCCFDIASISDVILHIKYTARDGGGALKAAALKKLPGNTASKKLN